MTATAQRPVAKSTSAVEPYVEKLDAATVKVERILPGPIERVWSYLIDSDKRAKWFAGGPMVLKDGGDVTLSFRNNDLSSGHPNPNSTCAPDGVDMVMHGVITRCEPPHVLAFNWSKDQSGSQVTLELSPQGPDTKLIVTHQRLASRKQLLGVSAGWHTHIGILIDLLSGDTPRVFWPEHMRLEKIYAERFAE